MREQSSNRKSLRLKQNRLLDSHLEVLQRQHLCVALPEQVELLDSQMQRQQIHLILKQLLVELLLQEVPPNGVKLQREQVKIKIS